MLIKEKLKLKSPSVKGRFQHETRLKNLLREGYWLQYDCMVSHPIYLTGSEGGINGRRRGDVHDMLLTLVAFVTTTN